MGPRGCKTLPPWRCARGGAGGCTGGGGAPRIHPGAYLNEFAVRVPDARAVHRRLLDRGVLAGLALADVEPADPELRDALLVCATELTTADEIRRFATALRAELARDPVIETAASR